MFGTATTKVIPDKMLWRVQVRNRGQLLENVAKEHMHIVGNVTSFVKGSVLEEDIQTSRMEFGENWGYRDRSRIKEGYYAQTYITFTMTDFNNYGKIWMGLSKIKDVSVLDISYDHTEKIKHQNETRIKALLAAKEKAEVLAKSIGSGIAEPLLIEEIWPGNDVELKANVAREVMLRDGGEGTPISPGQIPIRMRVKVSFRLVTHN